MPVTFRPLGPADAPFLRRMLYHALFVPAGQPPFDPAAVDAPEIARYVRGWGCPGDLGLAAVAAEAGREVGAAWLR